MNHSCAYRLIWSRNDYLISRGNSKLIKKIIKRIIGDGVLGRLDYILYPDIKNSWGGPFNGQSFRTRIFFDILHSQSINSIVETGTYRGTTTALFAATSLPVYTVEENLRFLSYAKMRFFLNQDNVTLFNNDSRAFLRELSSRENMDRENVFFYLDAHWGDDLPLREEIELIFSNWKNPIVMIDDFCVPGSEYGYDDYGSGKVLNMGYLEQAINDNNLSAFFPKAKSSEETGKKRGCIVLCMPSAAERFKLKSDTLVESSSVDVT